MKKIALPHLALGVVMALALLVIGYNFYQGKRREAFLEAARAGDTARVRDFLAQGMNPNLRASEEKTSVLNLALQKGHEETAIALIEAGARYEPRALEHFAYAMPKVLRLALKKRLASRAEPPDGPMLHQAARLDDLELTREILDRGVDVNATDSSKTPALLMTRRPEMIKLLLARRADPNRGDLWGNTALYRACQEGDLSLIRLLLKHGAQVNITTRQGGTPLMSLVARKNLEGVRLLLDHGANPNAGIARGVSLLDSISLWQDGTPPSRDTALARFLLERGAQVSARSGAGSQLLLRAAQLERWELVDLLTAKGLSLNARSADYGETALLMAARNGRKQTVAALLARGADPNVRTNYGYTAFHWAAAKTDPETLRQLLARGADRNARGADGVNAFHMAAKHGNLPCLKFLLESGADLHARTSAGATALMLAAGATRKEAVDFLLKRGAVVQDRDDRGDTPLHYATINGAVEIGETLIARGADVNARNAEGRTPLFYAVTRQADKPNAMLDLLLARKAEVNIRDVKGRSLLELAQRRLQFPEIAEKLRQAGANE